MKILGFYLLSLFGCCVNLQTCSLFHGNNNLNVIDFIVVVAYFVLYLFLYCCYCHLSVSFSFVVLFATVKMSVNSFYFTKPVELKDLVKKNYCFCFYFSFHICFWLYCTQQNNCEANRCFTFPYTHTHTFAFYWFSIVNGEEGRK